MSLPLTREIVLLSEYCQVLPKWVIFWTVMFRLLKTCISQGSLYPWLRFTSSNPQAGTSSASFRTFQRVKRHYTKRFTFSSHHRYNKLRFSDHYIPVYAYVFHALSVYRDAIVQVRPKLVERIKACPSLLRVIKGLKECNLEFLTVDSRTVTTEHPDALIRYGLFRKYYNPLTVVWIFDCLISINRLQANGALPGWAKSGNRHISYRG